MLIKKNVEWIYALYSVVILDSSFFLILESVTYLNYETDFACCRDRTHNVCWFIWRWCVERILPVLQGEQICKFILSMSYSWHYLPFYFTSFSNALDSSKLPMLIGFYCCCCWSSHQQLLTRPNIWLNLKASFLQSSMLIHFS